MLFYEWNKVLSGNSVVIMKDCCRIWLFYSWKYLCYVVPKTGGPDKVIVATRKGQNVWSFYKPSKEIFPLNSHIIVSLFFDFYPLSKNDSLHMLYDSIAKNYHFATDNSLMTWMKVAIFDGCYMNWFDCWVWVTKEIWFKLFFTKNWRMECHYSI